VATAVMAKVTINGVRRAETLLKAVQIGLWGVNNQIPCINLFDYFNKLILKSLELLISQYCNCRHKVGVPDGSQLLVKLNCILLVSTLAVSDHAFDPMPSLRIKNRSPYKIVFQN
jgi:hypothetical protein